MFDNFSSISRHQREYNMPVSGMYKHERMNSVSKKFVYLFSEGNATMRELLGGKGANLAEMTHIGLPVPQGFTITTEACTQYYEDGQKINDEIMAEIMEYVEKMEEINGKKFGDLTNPLLAQWSLPRPSRS